MNWTNDLLDLVGLGRKSFWGRVSDRFLHAIEQTGDSLGEATSRAAEVAEGARERTGAGLREARDAALSGARAGRDAVSARADAIGRRAAEIRERRRSAREQRREARRRRAASQRRRPMHVDLRDTDRIVIRGRRPLDLRIPGGGMIRYRYHRRPSRALRAYLRLTGRRVWPRR